MRYGRRCRESIFALTILLLMLPIYWLINMSLRTQRQTSCRD